MTSVPGLHMLAFERRAAVFYEIKAREVVIIRILYGGRDFERLLGGEP